MNENCSWSSKVFQVQYPGSMSIFFVPFELASVGQKTYFFLGEFQYIKCLVYIGAIMNI